MANYVKIPKYLKQKFSKDSGYEDSPHDFPFVMTNDNWSLAGKNDVCIDGWATLEQLEKIVTAIKQLDLNMKEYVRELAE